MSATVTQLRLKQVELHGGTQAREKTDQATVDDYADLYRRGVELPPVVVFFDGARYWLADGFHRVYGLLAVGRACLLAEVRQGTQRDALLFAAGANSGHGLRRTNADKRRAVTMLLADEEWRQWNDKEIAGRCAVSERFVGLLRRELKEREKPPAELPTDGASVNGSPIDTRKATRNGTTYTMDVSRMNGPKPDLETLEADALEARRHSENRRHLERIGKRLSQCAVELRALDGLDADEGRQHLESLQGWVEGHLAAVPA